MNAAALKANLDNLKDRGTVIVNEEGFDSKNLRLAKYEDGVNPIENDSLADYEVFKIPVTKLTKECLKDSGLGTKEQDRSKNMFVLGFILWRYSRSLDSVTHYLEKKFAKKPELVDANKKVLKAGYHYGDTTETFTTSYEIKSAPLEKGTYRNITGGQALVYGLITASQKSGLPLFYGSYPITPASDVLHLLAAQKHFGVKTFQAEDEIAAVCAAIGASYGGNLGITGTSGPGLALKGEAMGLAMILELPLVILNIQRGGPSTGMPTKTEQADLLMAMYGRNGESPLPIIAAQSPADAFMTAYEACKIAIQHMTPVILLSDGYIANGAEPWKFPNADDIEKIQVNFAVAKKADEDTNQNGEAFLPYKRDENLVRKWAIPGTPGLGHRIGGLEKEYDTGNVSYDPDNHELMTKTRADKISKIANFLPEQKIHIGAEKGKVLVLGWGSTFGVINAVVHTLIEEGYEVSSTHLCYLNPFPKNLETLLNQFDKIIIPEINTGQLATLIKAQFLKEVVQFNKVRGLPISKIDLYNFIKQQL